MKMKKKKKKKKRKNASKIEKVTPSMQAYPGSPQRNLHIINRTK
jgi:hypothetical protein